MGTPFCLVCLLTCRQRQHTLQPSIHISHSVNLMPSPLSLPPKLWATTSLFKASTSTPNPSTHTCICNQLEPYFPEIHQNRKSTLVVHTLAGAKCYQGIPTKQKMPLTIANLVTVSNDLACSTFHDDFLFDTLLNTGFTGLLHLGELTWPDDLSLRDYKKVMMCFSLEWVLHAYSFWLPAHKSDTTFEGNWIVVKKISGAPEPFPIMDRYIKSRDRKFPLHPQLWLKSDGTIPARSWFIKWLHHYFGSEITGQSLHAGGATAMAEAGAVSKLIKGAGQWSSGSFKRYIRRNPIVLHALILSRSSHYNNNGDLNH